MKHILIIIFFSQFCVSYGQNPCFSTNNKKVSKLFSSIDVKRYEYITDYDTAQKKCWDRYLRPYQASIIGELIDLRHQLDTLVKLTSHQEDQNQNKKMLKVIQQHMHNDSIFLNKQIREFNYCKNDFKNSPDKIKEIEKLEALFDSIPDILVKTKSISISDTSKSTFEIIYFEDEGIAMIFDKGHNIVCRIEEKNIIPIANIFALQHANRIQILDQKKPCPEFDEKAIELLQHMVHLRSWSIKGPIEKKDETRAMSPPKEVHNIVQEIVKKLFD